jgi:glycosyltransferase involved in cell wall biosynthesis
VATHVVNLVRGLIKFSKAVSVDVLTLRRGALEYKKDSKGRLTEWKLDRQTVPEFDGRRVAVGRFVNFALEHWRELRPDVIHVHDFDSLQIGWLLRSAFSIPLVLTVHRAPTKWRQHRYRENEKDCFMHAARLHKVVDQVVVPSEASARVLKDQGFRKIKVIPHGISRHMVTFASDSSVVDNLNLPAGATVIFCPCRADEHKDLPLFVRGAALLRNQLQQPTAFVVTSKLRGVTANEPPEVAELSEIARVHGLVENRDIFFTAPFEYGCPLATIYRRASVVVVPSIHESFGQTVLDGFMFGRPVVARDSMALADIIDHRVNGLLFETAKDMAWQVRQLLDDRELSAQIVTAAKRSFAEQYTVEKMAAEYLSLYDDVIRLGREKGAGRADDALPL